MFVLSQIVLAFCAGIHGGARFAKLKLLASILKY